VGPVDVIAVPSDLCFLDPCQDFLCTSDAGSVLGQGSHYHLVNHCHLSTTEVGYSVTTAYCGTRLRNVADAVVVVGVACCSGLDDCHYSRRCCLCRLLPDLSRTGSAKPAVRMSWMS